MTSEVMHRPPPELPWGPAGPSFGGPWEGCGQGASEQNGGFADRYPLGPLFSERELGRFGCQSLLARSDSFLSPLNKPGLNGD